MVESSGRPGPPPEHSVPQQRKQDTRGFLSRAIHSVRSFDARSVLKSLTRGNTTIQSPQAELPVNPEKPLTDDYVAYFPGVTGGGKIMTAIRDHIHTTRGYENAYVAPSSSSPAAFKIGERSIFRHYRNLAREIAARAGNRKLSFQAHSMADALEVLNLMIDKDMLKTDEVDINFISPYGFGGEGLPNLINFARNTFKLQSKVALLEQHTAYPLPEQFYENKPAFPVPEGTKAVRVDTPQDRQDRRVRFGQWMRAMVPDETARTAVMSRLHTIDEELLQAATEEQSEEAMEARTEVLRPIIQQLFRGEHIDDATHAKYLTMYRELTHTLAPTSIYYVNAALFFARAGRFMYRGMESVLADTIHKAEAKGKHITFAFTMLEHDTMVKPEDMPDYETVGRKRDQR
jgi:hypothetical protein